MVLHGEKTEADYSTQHYSAVPVKVIHSIDNILRPNFNRSHITEKIILRLYEVTIT